VALALLSIVAQSAHSHAASDAQPPGTTCPACVLALSPVESSNPGPTVTGFFAESSALPAAPSLVPHGRTPSTRSSRAPPSGV
jgi:hypothetical protein